MNKTDLTTTYEMMFVSSCISLALVLIFWDHSGVFKNLLIVQLVKWGQN